MQFRTEIELKPPPFPMEHHDSVFTIGSCFAGALSEKLQICQIRNSHNPFGTLFHPKAIEMALERIVAEEYYIAEELVPYNQMFLSLDHHSSFNASNADVCLEKINSALQQAHLFMKKSRWVIITLGTALVYNFRPTDMIVANCHKLPKDFFSKCYLTPNEIHQSIERIIELVQIIALPDVQIIFTISPIRHIKEGMIENQRSKSLLNVGLHHALQSKSNCHYLPIYEIMMDDLRDYRFYRNDMIHPTQQAFEYIWENFQAAYFSKTAQNYLSNNWKIYLDLQHRPFQTDGENYQNFLKQLKEKIIKQQKLVSFTIYKNELAQINQKLSSTQ